MKKYIIALDQGTTSSRALIFNRKGQEIAKAQKPLTSFFPHTGWVEQDPMEIVSSQVSVLSELLTLHRIDPETIDSIGITNQRETTIVWNRHTGKPIYNAIVWQSRQSASIIENLITPAVEADILERTGLRADAYFSASKIRFILDHVPGAQTLAEQGDLYFGTVDTWLTYNLTNQKVHKTDVTNASRTMLYNIETLEWDETLLKLFEIPRAMLPEVLNSSEYVGHYNYGGVQIPITALIGDQQSALFGQTCFEKGSMKNTYGTGCFLLMNTGDRFIRSKQGLVSSIGVGINNEIQYVLEGSVFSAGSIMTWLNEKMNLITDVKDSSAIAHDASDQQNVMMIPSFTGLGAPYWRMDTLASIINISLDTQPKHIIKAALDSIALQTYDVIMAIFEDSGIDPSALVVDGGMSANEYLMQTQANVLNTDIIITQTQETTALGAAYLAGLATGFFKDKEQLKSFTKVKQSYQSKIAKKERTTLIKDWHKALYKHLSE